MLWTSAKGKEAVWYPLAACGNWLEPESYNYGEVTRRLVLKKRGEAERIILKAQAINQEHIREVT